MARQKPEEPAKAIFEEVVKKIKEISEVRIEPKESNKTVSQTKVKRSRLKWNIPKKILTKKKTLNKIKPRKGEIFDRKQQNEVALGILLLL